MTRDDLQNIGDDGFKKAIRAELDEQTRPNALYEFLRVGSDLPMGKWLPDVPDSLEVLCDGRMVDAKRGACRLMLRPYFDLANGDCLSLTLGAGSEAITRIVTRAEAEALLTALKLFVRSAS